MKNRIFSPSLFFEGLKQLKIPGIIGCIVVFLGSALPSIYNVISCHHAEKAGVFGLSSELDIINMRDQLTVAYFIFLVFVPLMVLIIFNFLNKRNASDFYHAIPVRRQTIYVSFVAAVFVWAILMLAIVAIVPIAIMKPGFSSLSYHKLNYTEYFKTIFLVFSGCVYVIGCLAVGISVTGTIFTNLLVTAMIVIIPRLVLVLVIGFMSPILQFIPIGQMPEILSYSSNVIWGTIADVFTYSEVNTMTTAVYSIIVGAVFIVIGLFTFIKRKSESASTPSVNKSVQCLFRIIPAFILTACGTAGIVNGILYHRSFDGESIFYIIILYVVGVIVYFLYELMTTRRWKNVTQSVRQLPVLLILNVIIAIVLFVPSYLITHKVPDKIESIEINKITGNEMVFSNYKDKVIKSDEINDIILNAYRNQISNLNDSTDYYVYSADQYTYKIDLTMINQNDSLRRYVYLSVDDTAKLIRAALDDKSSVKVPKCSDYDTMGMYKCDLKPNQIKQLFKKLKSEIENNSDQISMIVNSDYRYDSIHYNTINDEFISLGITENTPETLKLYIDLVNKEEWNNSVVSKLDEYNYFNLSFTYRDKGSINSYNTYYDESNNVYEKERVKKFLDIIRNKDTKNIDLNKPIVYVECVSEESIIRGYFNLNDEDISELEQTFPVNRYAE